MSRALAVDETRGALRRFDAIALGLDAVFATE